MTTAVEWQYIELSKFINGKSEFTDANDILIKAQEIEKYNAKVEAKKYYLKGFEDAELTENQNCPHEQTMKDAETHFELVYPIKSEQ